MTARIVELREYEEREVELPSEAERVLRAVAGTRLITAPAGRRSFRIKATSHIGAITTPDVHVVIRPKIGIPTVLYLLESGGHLLRLDDDDVALAGTDDLVAAVATLFAAQLARLVRRGITRSYVQVSEQLSTLRGRLDLPAQQRSGGLNLPVACTYDDYQIDTRLNRRARTATLRLMGMPSVAPATGLQLRHLLATLDGAGPLQRVDLAMPTQFTRLDEHYRAVDGLATLILQNSSLDVRSGMNAASAFTIDMNVVFERFVTERLRRRLHGRLVVDAQRRTHLDHDKIVPIRPDLVLSLPHGADVMVADTKYKIAASGVGRETDYYQLLAYTAALGLPVGLLIYATDDQDPMPREIVVGAARSQLYTWAVNLNGRRRDIDQTIESLADSVFSLAASETAKISSAVGF